MIDPALFSVKWQYGVILRKFPVRNSQKPVENRGDGRRTEQQAGEAS